MQDISCIVHQGSRNLLDVELKTLPGDEESVPMLGAGA